MSAPETSEESAVLEKERQAIRLAVADITFAWAEVENSMVAVFARLIADRPIVTNTVEEVASAIFFSATGLNARINMVDRAFHAYFRMFKSPIRPDILEMVDRWDALIKATDRNTNTRNQVAHGQMTTTVIGKKRHVRLTTPLAEYQQLLRALSRPIPQVPGLSAKDISTAAERARASIAEYKIFAELIPLTAGNLTKFHEVLPEKLKALEALRPKPR
jgi:hypothetical protein